MRMNCNLFRAIKLCYVKSMIRYCNAYGWKYFWFDTFVSWWRIRKAICPKCDGDFSNDRLGKIKYSCMCGYYER